MDTFASIGDVLASKVDLLAKIRAKIGESSCGSLVITDDKWGAFLSVISLMKEAVEKKDIVSLVSATRVMKNKLRRPVIRECLSSLEMGEEETKKTSGKCRCSRCGSVIDGSMDPCKDGALCVKCGLSNDAIDDDDENDNGDKVSSLKKKKRPIERVSQVKRDLGI